MKILVVIKHIFIPHDENDFKPHFFRELSVSAFLFISVFLLGSSFGSSFFIHKTVLGAEIAASVLIDLTNENRIAYNQKPLVRSVKLDQAAELKGKDMSSKEYFSHDSPDGVTPWYWFRQVGYNFLYAGENLAINFTDATDVEEAWLGSPTHRANIMNTNFREIGIATVQGYYNNYPTIYIVQMFGTPAQALNTQAKSEKPIVKNISSSQSSTTTLLSKTSTSSEVLAGDVKGESIQASTTFPSVEKIVSTETLVIVKNNDAIEKQKASLTETPVYSTWYQKIIFNGSYYVDLIYKLLLLLVAFALVTMIMIEIRKQHFVHILYGVCLLSLLIVFIYINQSFF